MARYIDADALWKNVTGNIDDCADFLEIIERQPTIDHLAEVSKKGDLISRADAINAIFETFSTGDEGADRYIAEKILADVLSAQPEIIRCKDCRHNHNCDIQHHAQAGDMFFCAGAERRTDE